MQIHTDDKTAIIFGATGLVGSHLLKLLLDSPIYDRVKSFGRREVDMRHPKLEQHRVDFADLDQCRDLMRGEDVFCCIGTTRKKAGSKDAFYKVDFTFSHRIARLAESSNANQFLLITAAGADSGSFFFYNRVKGELEDAVKRMDFWAVHIFQPSLLLGERNESRWGESAAKVLGKAINAVSGNLLKKYQPIEAEVVARAMLAAAQGFDKGVHVYPSHELQDLAEDYYSQKRLR